ncbi:TetR/AcrR family transcriptional regulator [Pseudomonas gingeri]|uniref:TetR/AcrR family transcriptional regulator n=1 Tax=Pseudomonas gingeri TaxID=117681 RepID=A0A7Y7XBP3_9PSED|nr:TetR/AcrR family transcriptional regulator [Pseudomonas gingeri]NWB96776.1 TetR/AcrR family transcriptional regulator [Pseudomonas gingeri]NWD67226.1 TetR/AcrR family transcriptional regulator [Pseudomonas gingeri]
MSTKPIAKGQEPKRAKGHIRVAAILEAGVELFSEKGFDATTMTEIAARSGTAIASLYRFFPTKESVAEALLMNYVEHALQSLAELASQAHGMTPSALASAFVDFSLALQSRRQFAINLVDVAGASESRRQQFRKAMVDGIEAALREVIPALSAAKSKAVAVTLLNVFKGLGRISEETPATQRVLVAETKDMVRLYLAALEA